MTTTNATVIQTTSDAILQWQPATWEDYLACCDDPALERARIVYTPGQLLIDMTPEGIDHASNSDLFTMLFAFWFNRTQQTFSSLGRCLLEKPNTRAASPDLVVYIGENFPHHVQGELRRIDLNKWRVPDLVGEVSDTTLAVDLDEKKQLYASLGIPEFWVIDVKGKRVIAFQLANDKYQQCTSSLVLKNLPISLLEATLEQQSQETNGSAAIWFDRQIAKLSLE